MGYPLVYSQGKVNDSSEELVKMNKEAALLTPVEIDETLALNKTLDLSEFNTPNVKISVNRDIVEKIVLPNSCVSAEINVSGAKQHSLLNIEAGNIDNLKNLKLTQTIDTNAKNKLVYTTIIDDYDEGGAQLIDGVYVANLNVDDAMLFNVNDYLVVQNSDGDLMKGFEQPLGTAISQRPLLLQVLEVGSEHSITVKAINGKRVQNFDNNVVLSIDAGLELVKLESSLSQDITSILSNLKTKYPNTELYGKINLDFVGYLQLSSDLAIWCAQNNVIFSKNVIAFSLEVIPDDLELSISIWLDRNVAFPNGI